MKKFIDNLVEGTRSIIEGWTSFDIFQTYNPKKVTYEEMNKQVSENIDQIWENVSKYTGIPRSEER